MFCTQEGTASFRGLHEGEWPSQSSGLAKDRSVQPRHFFHTYIRPYILPAFLLSSFCRDHSSCVADAGITHAIASAGLVVFLELDAEVRLRMLCYLHAHSISIRAQYAAFTQDSRCEHSGCGLCSHPGCTASAVHGAWYRRCNTQFADTLHAVCLTRCCYGNRTGCNWPVE
jgi:hypothetical protein